MTELINAVNMSAMSTEELENSLIGKIITPKAAKKPKKVKPVVVDKPVEEAFILMEDADIFKARVQINSNDIKNILICRDSDIVSEHHILADNAKNRELRLVGCRFSIFDLLTEGRKNNWLTYKNRSNDWLTFTALMNTYEEKFKVVFADANKDTKVPFHVLPYVLKENKEYTFAEKDTFVAFTLKSATVHSSFFGDYLKIEGNVISHNGNEFSPGEYTTSVGAFSGEKTLSDIGITALEYFPEERQKLIERGKKYFKLHSNGPSYCQYVGPVVRRGWYKDILFQSTGRIMIDRAGMISTDPNYSLYFGNSENDRYDRNFKEKIVEEAFTDQQYLIMSPYCYGFSLISKQWGEFKVDSISDISFRTDAYSKLVLNPEIKDTMFSLVEYSGESKDIVDNKGGGCIFLLHGAPGCGKTLTAEAISETLHRPLYMVSVGELGTDVETLDSSLRNILQIASSWNAVLLIDEVDIFIEKRDLNIERNAMVGVFLRLLEYYNGILFLTSNRAKNIDSAFYSRISLAIKYPELSEDARYQIWENQLGLYGIEISPENLTLLSEAVINGRQIKNCVRLTVALAEKSGKLPGMTDIRKVLCQIQEFNQVLSE